MDASGKRTVTAFETRSPGGPAGVIVVPIAIEHDLHAIVTRCQRGEAPWKRCLLRIDRDQAFSSESRDVACSHRNAVVVRITDVDRVGARIFRCRRLDEDQKPTPGFFGEPGRQADGESRFPASRRRAVQCRISERSKCAEPCSCQITLPSSRGDSACLICSQVGWLPFAEDRLAGAGWRAPRRAPFVI